MTDEPHVVVSAAPHRDSATARRAAADFLAQHCPWADTDAVLLVVTELVANAVRHTTGWWRLHLTVRERELVVEMDDSSPQPPIPRRPEFAGGGGFGWQMVQRLAGRVEVELLPDGKRVAAIWLRPAASLTAG
ncbi:ATP-binding protein [Streptomyces sp. A3M-1-3]|uniref:ATP-binding protein n=1 Tax=Streptomyces sp. A3M-1-3 TaxID=2962044 RepID=UPI0020B80B16|nr:ATP-binding protein [Streptomyces sp. A3M-1-3]MCP3817017.1 ATP-binding protein [Streptomyces sp. A3M-1-3]